MPKIVKGKGKQRHPIREKRSTAPVPRATRKEVRVPKVRTEVPAKKGEKGATLSGWMPKGPEGDLRGRVIHFKEDAAQSVFFTEGWKAAQKSGFSVVKVKVMEVRE